MNTDLLRSQQRRIIADLVDGSEIHVADARLRWVARGEFLPTTSLSFVQQVEDNGVYVLVEGERPLSGSPGAPWQFICRLDDIVGRVSIYFDNDEAWEAFVAGYRMRPMDLIASN